MAGDSAVKLGYQTPTDFQERPMAEHQHGSMNTSHQEKTFAGFLRLATWAAGISIGILIFLALVNS